MSKDIQEQFGSTVIQTIIDFAKSDLKSVHQLENDEFSHIDEDDLRKSLALTYYGARWIYKLGLALLIKDEEQMAHVRTQVVDYGSVCEGLLSGCLLHALKKNCLRGKKYQYKQLNKTNRRIKKTGKRINWKVRNPFKQLQYQNFEWHIEVAAEEGIINHELKAKLHQMRRQRNTIHLRKRTEKAFLGTSRNLYLTVRETIEQTKRWRNNNP